MPLTRLRHRKADAYAVSVSSAVPRYYAFLDTGHLVAALYASDGTFLADRGSIPLSGESLSGGNGTLIAIDPNAAVGPGSLAWRSGDNELTVWDVAAAQLHTYQGTVAAWCSPPVYHQGQLWWVEFPDHEDEPNTNQATLTLRTAACDLSNPQTVATVVFSALVASWDLFSAATVAATPTSLHFATTWYDNLNFEVTDAAGARFAFDLTGAESQDGAGLGLVQGFAAADGTSLGLAVPSNTLRSLPPTLGADTDPRWPTTGAWALAQGFGQAINAAVSTDGITALLYGTPPEGDLPVIIEAPSTATAGEPTARVSVARHPIHDAFPNLLFFLE